MRNTFNPSTVIESLELTLPIVLRTKTVDKDDSPDLNPGDYRLAVWFEVGGVSVGKISYLPGDREPTIEQVFQTAMKGAMGVETSAYVVDKNVDHNHPLGVSCGDDCPVLVQWGKIGEPKGSRG